VAEEQTLDPFNVAPAGHSLTEDNSKWAWGQPPEMVNPDEVLDYLVDRIMVPRKKQQIAKMLMVGVSVEVMVEGIIFQGFRDGKFSPDVGILIKGPLGIVIADMAEEENIPYRLFENNDTLDEGDMDDETFMRLMKENNPKMFDYVRENLNAAIRRGAEPEEPSFMNADREGEQ
tara:strand:+ start:80 stop:601 length:522 start_codon:yes stop_codon:yes gene_type:complete